MPEDEWLPIVKDRTIDAMMAMIRDDLALLNVHHDVFFSERSLHADDAKAIRAAINDLTLQGPVYKGTLPPPKGQLPEDWEDREQTLFRSTEFGDDIDRPLMKSDGSYTYFAADVAYHKDKFDRGFDEMIDVLGADHGGYVKRMEAWRGAVAGGEAKLDVLLCQLVKLFRDGEPVRMSKRVRRVRHAARRGRGGRPRPGPLHDAVPQERRAARLRLRQGHGAVEGQSGLLRAVRLGALPLGVPAGERAARREADFDRAALGGRTSVC